MDLGAGAAASIVKTGTLGDLGYTIVACDNVLASNGFSSAPSLLSGRNHDGDRWSAEAPRLAAEAAEVPRLAARTSSSAELTPRAELAADTGTAELALV